MVALVFTFTFTISCQETIQVHLDGLELSKKRTEKKLKISFKLIT